MELAQRQCVPCRGVPPVKGEALSAIPRIAGWLEDDQRASSSERLCLSIFTKKLSFRFTNLIANLAESEGHHPELILSFRNVRVSYWTHKIDGLVESDFIMAAKSDLIHANEFPAT